VELQNGGPLIIHCMQYYYKQMQKHKRKKIICNFKISALSGIWFFQAVINITTVCRLICYVMMMNAPQQRFLEKELNISSHAAIDWVNFCREVIILCSFMILFVNTLYILINI